MDDLASKLISLWLDKAPVSHPKTKREDARGATGQSGSVSSSLQQQTGSGSFENGQPALPIQLTNDKICRFCVRLKEKCLCKQRRSAFFSSAGEHPTRSSLERLTADLVRHRSYFRFDVGTREENENVEETVKENSEKNETDTQLDTSDSVNELLLNILDLHRDEKDSPEAYKAAYMALSEVLKLSPEQLKDPYIIVKSTVSRIQKLTNKLKEPPSCGLPEPPEEEPPLSGKSSGPVSRD